MISVGEVNARVAQLAEDADDFEAAHAEEDGIWKAALLAIAQGAGNPRELARAALRSEEIEFQRVCA